VTPLHSFSVNFNARIRDRRGASDSSMHKREKRQHDCITRVVIDHLKSSAIFIDAETNQTAPTHVTPATTISCLFLFLVVLILIFIKSTFTNVNTL
jgi:hypothetical protein